MDHTRAACVYKHMVLSIWPQFCGTSRVFIYNKGAEVDVQPLDPVVVPLPTQNQADDRRVARMTFRSYHSQAGRSPGRSGEHPLINPTSVVAITRF